MKQRLFRDLGERFYEWRKSDRVKFLYGTEDKDLDSEIERISEFIEYVRGKKGILLHNIT